MYSRDATFNQVASKLADLMQHDRPTPSLPVTGMTLDGGAITVLGAATASGRPLVPGTKDDIYVYFQTTGTPTAPLRLGITLWPGGPAGATPLQAPAGAVKVSPRATGDGTFATDRWRTGELIRERFPITVPAAWTGSAASLVLVVSGPSGPTGAGAPPTGPVADHLAGGTRLGTLPLQAPANRLVVPARTVVTAARPGSPTARRP